MSNSIYIHPVVRLGKWLTDKITALLGCLLLIILLPFLSLLIKLDSKGPIFFLQTRVGEQDYNVTRYFRVIKFRTMHINAESDGKARWATEDDPRITRVGKILRKTRLDEFPQFINVLKGDMSLIGPRPERPEFYHQLEKHIPFYSERIYGIKPGITGFAQIKVGYDKSIEDAKDKAAYDNAYSLVLANPSQWIKTDLMIVYQTFLVIIKRKGQ